MRTKGNLTEKVGSKLDSPLIQTLLNALDRLEEKLVNAQSVDNSRVVGVSLRLYPDGSGSVDLMWNNCAPDRTKAKKFLDAIFFDETEGYQFEGIEDLVDWLKSKGVWEDVSSNRQNTN